MNSRQMALKMIQKRKEQEAPLLEKLPFSIEVFQGDVVEKALPKQIVSHLKEVMAGRVKLNPVFAEPIAEAMKNWAIQQGATHFCHWFQPLTGFSAEKQDAFFDWNRKGEGIETLTAKQLLRGELDASSVPHGGLRNTYAARGYTTWDPSASVFLKGVGGSKVLCIPSVCFSWKGHALDFKIPLMRSEDKLRVAMRRLLSLLDVKAEAVFSTLGCEQEYFLIDRAYYLLRPDLMLTGRTLCGMAPAKGQELGDFYFGSIKSRVGSFMIDLERRALAVGIPLKTRHSEVAPGQFEFAPLFEKTSLSVDHNVLLMELMQEVAASHHLACLLHEKPFARVNGSGKHCNWSLATDTGLNLLDPQCGELLFLTVLTSVLYAVYEHGALLRASVASAGNDHRLGGHEAPPAIISVHLGEALERWLFYVEEGGGNQEKAAESLNLMIPQIPDILLDAEDRNRTSPFAFTGNKFEFRAVGSSQHCALPITVLNAIVAESMNQIVDEIEKDVMKKKPLEEVVYKVIRKYLKVSKPVRFSGDNYSASWRKEAKKRRLPILDRSVETFAEWITPKSVKVFEDILSRKELESRKEILSERYWKTLNIETRLMRDLFHTTLLPVALQYQKEVAQSLQYVRETGKLLSAVQTSFLNQLSKKISQAMQEVHLLEKANKKALAAPLDRRAFIYADVVVVHLQRVREALDDLEGLLDDRLWPLPKYQEMLHIL